jgi:hypothetical protein
MRSPFGSTATFVDQYLHHSPSSRAASSARFFGHRHVGQQCRLPVERGHIFDGQTAATAVTVMDSGTRNSVARSARPRGTSGKRYDRTDVAHEFALPSLHLFLAEGRLVSKAGMRSVLGRIHLEDRCGPMPLPNAG